MGLLVLGPLRPNSNAWYSYIWRVGDVSLRRKFGTVHHPDIGGFRDFNFMLVLLASDRLPGGYRFLLVGPIIDGLLGGMQVPGQAESRLCS